MTTVTYAVPSGVPYMPIMFECPACEGQGEVGTDVRCWETGLWEMVTCGRCGGLGAVEYVDPTD